MEQKVILTTQEVPFKHYGNVSYRIELDHTNKHRPLQRHIWTKEDGKIETGPWLDGFYDTPEHLASKGWLVRNIDVCQD